MECTRAPCPQVTSVLDLLTVRFPELRSSKVHFWLYKYCVPFCFRNADCLVAISKSTRRDLLSLYGHYENVRDVYCGYNTDIFHTDTSNDADILNMYHLRPGYILFVGYITPKKNLQVIARSLKLLKDKYRFTPQLVICGKRGYGAEEILSTFSDLSIQDQVFELGFLPTRHLGALYRQAKLFVFPSIYEGFGLPVVESMACRTPVIVSNAGSLVELVENSAITCPPDSIECWAEKMRILLQDPEHHSAAREWCLRRAKLFSWDACAEAMMDIYVSLVSAARSN